MLPAPDGKIYIFDFLKQIHVINKPNEKGSACDVRQGYIILPEYPAGIPYYPNYRLGPLDGSACDTLGIDNHPLAGFNWELADTMNPLQVEFTDNSFYEPTDWFWDFGGTGTSTEVNPLHTFPDNGTYQVCLTVSNQYDSDTFCREVTVGVTGTREEKETAIFKVSPNPAQQDVTIEYLLPVDWERPRLLISSATGTVVAEHPVDPALSILKLPVGDLPNGIYILQFQAGNAKSQLEKLIILR
jgi:PKD repeat protein